MPKTEWSPRLNIRVTPEQFTKLQNMCDFGVKQRLFDAIIKDLIALHDKYGPIIITEIIEGNVSVQKFNRIREHEQAPNAPQEHQPAATGRKGTTDSRHKK